MEERVAALVSVSAAIAARDEADLADAMDRALEASGALAVEECVLQSYIFLGYPIALEAMALWRRRSRAAAGPPATDAHTWPARGEEVCRTVYAGRYEELRANVRALHPDLERWMVTEGYGKVLGRPRLPLATRELCAVALLAVLDAPRQLYSHLRGALHAGASVAEVEEALAVASRHGGARAAEHAEATWGRLCTRLERR